METLTPCWPRLVAPSLGAYAFGGGLLTLAGWFAHVPRLTDWTNNGTAMQPNTAVCAVGAGAALLLRTFSTRRLPVVLIAAVVSLLGFATLLEHLTGVALGIDTLLLVPQWGLLTTAPGRMGPPACTSWAILGISLMMMSGGIVRQRAAVVGGILASAIATLSLVGFLFNADLLFTLPRLTAIALQTATMILAVGLGLIAALPDRQPMKTLRANTTAGVLARHTLPWLTLVPLTLGWLRVGGQQAGLYDTAFGTALRTVVEFAFLLALFWWMLAKVDAKETALRGEQERQRIHDLETRQTAMKLAGEALLARHAALASEERFRAIAENIPQLAWLADASGRIGWFNRRWLEFTGTTLEANHGDGWKAALHPEQARAVSEKLERHLREGKDWEDTFPLRRQDGEYRWFLSRMNAIRDEAGNVVHFFGTNTDITDLRETEQALSLSERRFRVAVSTVSNIVWTNNAEGKMAGEQPGWENFTGQTRDQYQDYGWAQAVHPDDVQPTLVGWERAVAERCLFDFEHRIRRADGEWRWCSVRAVPLMGPDGAIREWVGVHTDITERRQAEANVTFLSAISQELAGTAGIDDMMSRVGTKLGAHFRLSRCSFVEIIEASGEALVTHEWRRPDVLATMGVHRLADFVRPEFLDSFRAGQTFIVRDTADDPRMDAEKTAAIQVRAAVSVPVARDGKWKYALVYHDSSPRSWRDDEIDLMREITSRVWASIERARSEEALHQAKAAAEAANRSKDHFLAVLSHELRTPLNPVLLIASEAAADFGLPPAVREDFTIIAKNVAIETQLIDDLLDLTKIARGKLTLERRPLDVQTVLQDAIALIEQDVAEKRIELSVSLAAGPQVASADPVRLQQIFWNILKNAVKFTPDGGKVTVTCRAREANRVMIEIEDSGIGLTPDELRRVFDAFSQGDHAGEGSSHRFGGLGLGLAISRTLTELHGGSVRASSPGPGLGAHFVVELPLLSAVASDEARMPMRSQRAPHASRGVRILLVEDHAPTRLAVETLLTRRHHQVTTASTVSNARELADAERFDLLISDIGLPDASGYDLMAELRERFQLKGIALSGYGTENDIEKGRRAGFLAHLTKPVNVQALDATLSAVLDPDLS